MIMWCIADFCLVICQISRNTSGMETCKWSKSHQPTIQSDSEMIKTEKDLVHRNVALKELLSTLIRTITKEYHMKKNKVKTSEELEKERTKKERERQERKNRSLRSIELLSRRNSILRYAHSKPESSSPYNKKAPVDPKTSYWRVEPDGNRSSQRGKKPVYTWSNGPKTEKYHASYLRSLSGKNSFGDSDSSEKQQPKNSFKKLFKRVDISKKHRKARKSVHSND